MAALVVLVQGYHLVPQVCRIRWSQCSLLAFRTTVSWYHPLSFEELCLEGSIAAGTGSWLGQLARFRKSNTHAFSAVFGQTAAFATQKILPGYRAQMG